MNVIEVDKLSKKFKLGVYGGKSLRDDFSAWVAKMRGKENPLITIGDKSRVDQKGEFWALRDINFSVKQGEVLGIIGKNGAGKSTLLKLLSRISYPTIGEIRIKGRIASLLEVGTGFHPELTGRENVFLNGAILGMSRHDVAKKFDEIIAFSGIEHHIDTPTKRYSSGMKVRLGFAVAAHLEPELLIVDEVLAVGDADFQRKCIGKMQDVAGSGRTVLFVSHNMASVKNLCSRGILLEQGQKIFDGSIDDVVAKYIIGNTENLDIRNVKEWIPSAAPSYEGIQLYRAKYSLPETLPYITMNDEIEFSYEFNNDKILEHVSLNFHLLNEESVVVFGSSSLESGISEIIYPGKVEFKVTIPANLLNSGFYQIKLLLVKDGKIVLKVSDVLNFSVEEGNLKERVRFNRRAGVIRPMLNWTLKQEKGDFK